MPLLPRQAIGWGRVKPVAWALPALIRCPVLKTSDGVAVMGVVSVGSETAARPPGDGRCEHGAITTSTQPPRKDHGAFDNLMRGLGRRRKVTPTLMYATILLLAACGSNEKTQKASSDPPPTVANQGTAPRPTDTAKPASTANPTNTPKPTSSPKPTNTPKSAPATSPATAAPSTAAVQPTAAAPAPTATSVPLGFNLPACYVAGQDKCNCSHFATQAYAQWFHNNYDQADVNKLDNNNDGVVCEGNR